MHSLCSAVIVSLYPVKEHTPRTTCCCQIVSVKDFLEAAAYIIEQGADDNFDRFSLELIILLKSSLTSQPLA